jgi:hypothetical protein
VIGVGVLVGGPDLTGDRYPPPFQRGRGVGQRERKGGAQRSESARFASFTGWFRCSPLLGRILCFVVLDSPNRMFLIKQQK